MSQDTVSQEPVEIFISYSRKDRRYAEELLKHLSIDQFSGGRIKVWYDANLTPGMTWEKELHGHFLASKIILLLVSPDFFASDYCMQREMPDALQLRQETGAIVVPVIIRPVQWKRSKLAKLMVLPKSGKPIAEWSNEDQGFEDVASSLFETLDNVFETLNQAIERPSAKDPGPRESAPAIEEPPVSPSRRSTDRPESPKPAQSPRKRVPPKSRVKPTPVAKKRTDSSPSARPPASVNESARAPGFTILVCFVHPERRQKLLGLRKWCREAQDVPNSTKVRERKNLKEAFRKVCEAPDTTLLLLDGFLPGSQQLAGLLKTSEPQQPLNVIINSPESGRIDTATSSDSQSPFVVTTDRTLFQRLQATVSDMLKRAETNDVTPSNGREDGGRSLDGVATDSGARPPTVDPQTHPAEQQAIPPEHNGPSRPGALPGASPSAEDAAAFCESVTTTALTVVVCFVHPERRQKLLRLRKWSRSTSDPLIANQKFTFVEARVPEEAIQRLSEAPETTVLLLDGFEPGTPQLDELLETTHRNRLFNVIINSPEWDQTGAEQPSASILQPRHSVTTDDTLLPALRKALLRVRTRKYASVRVLDSREDLAAFFQLRYRVWSELGYLSEEKKAAEIPWELDYTDRTSLPVGVFSKVNGKLLGGARLVRGLGRDYPELIRQISSMLEEQQAETLKKNFEYPTFTTHPYDILGELDRFKEYYRGLVLSRTPKAEVSRVVVENDYRKLGLGEVIVDTLCSLAKMNAIRVLFLACHSKHADFYRRSHFREVAGVEGNKFLTYEVPCIAMERKL